MTLEEIQKNIDAIDANFHEHFDNASEYERLLSRAVKLNEEVGELCEAVLNEGKEQRADKIGINLGSEIADVIICTFLIAKMKGISVGDEIEKKLREINTRFKI